MGNHFKFGDLNVIIEFWTKLIFFLSQLQLMTHPDPSQRPTAGEILNHPVLNPSEMKTKRQLCAELNIEKKKNELLMRKLRETKALLKSYELSKTPHAKNKIRNKIMI